MTSTLSPAVTIAELEVGLFVENLATQPTAFVGSFAWGPASQAVLVANEQDLIVNFGKLNKENIEYWLTAADFLQYARSLYVGRAVDASTARNAIADGQTLLSLSVTDVAGDFAEGMEVTINTSPATVADVISWDELTGVLVVDAASAGLTLTDFANKTVSDTAVTPLASGTVSVALGSHILLHNDKESTTAINAGATFAGTGVTPVFVARYPGKIANGLGIAIVDTDAENVTFTGVGYTINNLESKVKPLTGSAGTSTYAAKRGFANIKDLFHILVIDAAGNFTGTPGAILEKFEGVSKLEDAKNDTNETIYWKNVINDRSEYLWAITNPVVANGVPTETVARVDYIATGLVALLAADVDNFTAPFLDPAALRTAFGVDTLANGTRFLLNNQSGGTNAVNGFYTWVTVSSDGKGYAKSETTAIDAIAYIRSTGQYFKKTASTTFTPVAPASVDSQVAEIVSTTENEYGYWGLNLTTGVSSTSALTKMATVTANGDSVNGWTTVFSGGTDGSTSDLQDDIQQVYTNAFKKSAVNVRQIIGGPVTAATAKFLLGFAEERQDCVVFLSPEKSTQVGLTNLDRIVRNVVNWTSETLNTPSSYGFLDGGWYLRFDKYSGKNVWVPLCGQTAGLSARIDSKAFPWFSFAGYIEGVYRNVIALAYNPELPHRDLLYPAGVNPVISEPSAGVVLLGDRTLLTAPSAFSRINVRKLFIAIEQQIADYSKFSMFVINDAVSRTTYVNAVTSFLEDIKQHRGITEYSVRCDEQNNNAQVRANNRFVADNFIKPASVADFINTNFVAVGQTLDISSLQV